MRLDKLFKVLVAGGATLTTGSLGCGTTTSDSRGLPVSNGPAKDDADAGTSAAPDDLSRVADMAVVPDLAAVDAHGVGSWLKWF
jgi:hypothetical protein